MLLADHNLVVDKEILARNNPDLLGAHFRVFWKPEDADFIRVIVAGTLIVFFAPGNTAFVRHDVYNSYIQKYAALCEPYFTIHAQTSVERCTQNKQLYCSYNNTSVTIALTERHYQQPAF